MSVFAPEIVSFDIVPPLQTAGAEAFEKHWQQLFASYQAPIDIELSEIGIAATDDVAFSYCLHRIKGTLKNGQQTDLWQRWTACYRKINGQWLIVHEQVSVPVELATGKAMLNLTP